MVEGPSGGEGFHKGFVAIFKSLVVTHDGFSVRLLLRVLQDVLANNVP